jgi:hypothetical protein
MYPRIRKITPKPNIQIVSSPIINKALEAPDLRRITTIAPPHCGQVLEARRAALVFATTNRANGD